MIKGLMRFFGRSGTDAGIKTDFYIPVEIYSEVMIWIVLYAELN